MLRVSRIDEYFMDTNAADYMEDFVVDMPL